MIWCYLSVQVHDMALSHGRPLWPTIFYLKEDVRISQKNVVDD